MEGHQILRNKLLTARAVGFIVQGSLYLINSARLLAGSRLLTLVSIAHHILELVLPAHHLTIHNNPRDPLVILRSLVSSLQMQQRTLSTLRAFQNHRSINSSLLRAFSHTLVREISRGLLTHNEFPPLAAEVLLSAQFHEIAIALLIAMLALEGRRIAGKHMSIAVGNKLKIGNGHQISLLVEGHQILRNKLLAARAVGFVVQGCFYLLGL